MVSKIYKQGVRIMAIGALAYVLAMIMVISVSEIPDYFTEGHVVTHDIRAEADYEIIDTQATEKLRELAREQVPLILDFDTLVFKDLSDKLSALFEQSRKIRQEAVKNTEAKARWRIQFMSALAISLHDSEWNLLWSTGFSDEILHLLMTLIEPYQHKMLAGDDLKQRIAQRDKPLVVRLLGLATPVEEELKSGENMLSLTAARDLLKREAFLTVVRESDLTLARSENGKLFAIIAQKLLRPNMSENLDETLKRREKAVLTVQNVVHKIAKGQMIARRGDRLEDRHMIVLEPIRELHQQQRGWTKCLLIALGLFIVLLVLRGHLALFPVFKLTLKDEFLLAITLISCLILVRAGQTVLVALQEIWSGPLASLCLLLPVQAFAMLVAVAINNRMALVVGFMTSLLAGLFLEQDLFLALYYLLMSLVGVGVMADVSQRGVILLRGLFLGVAGVLFAFGANVLANAQEVIPNTFWMGGALFAFLSGPLSAMAVLVFTPLLEALFGYTTNIQLMELASMNHPLLREMVVRAPGTYLHSQLVGTLAEAAAREIGANPLLARVGGYYHDIGKMKKPQYFIENQRGAKNPHDELSPSMSAMIIADHVKEGIEMAREARLPKLIQAFIPEHQGTKLVGFFYHKAKELAPDESIDEKLFRYKGPKPHTRESGIVMLSDTVESAVRSMPLKNPHKIEALVEKLMSQHFVDGQLSECDLTLKELSAMSRAFVRILVSVYHERLEYPHEPTNTKSWPRVTKLFAEPRS